MRMLLSQPSSRSAAIWLPINAQTAGRFASCEAANAVRSRLRVVGIAGAFVSVGFGFGVCLSLEAFEFAFQLPYAFEEVVEFSACEGVAFGLIKRNRGCAADFHACRHVLRDGGAGRSLHAVADA